MNTVKFYRSGLVRRWHQNPEMSQFGQNNASHQWGVATLMLILFPDASRDELISALTHDVGEIDAGDIANPTKNGYPKVAEMHAIFEHNQRREILGGNLSQSHTDTFWNGDERLWLCDKLEAVLYMLIFNPSLANKRGWPGHVAEVKRMASKLGCLSSVNLLLDGVNT